MLSTLSKEELLEVYKKALELKLERAFITLLEEEIHRRALQEKDSDIRD
ncbi:sporulation histidine kinase inhibitor Sda [Caldalkalibacillus salinus]|nr:sporulation histidine kinase inhibitor Sda [Caldalkalibacillus salinus]